MGCILVMGHEIVPTWSTQPNNIGTMVLYEEQFSGSRPTRHAPRRLHGCGVECCDAATTAASPYVSAAADADKNTAPATSTQTP